MQKSLIPALGGGASFVGSVAVQLLVPTAPSWVGWGLAGLAVALLAVAMGLWLAAHPRAEGGTGGVNQDSRGPHSPNIGTNHGTIVFGPPPPEAGGFIADHTRLQGNSQPRRTGPIVEPLGEMAAHAALVRARKRPMEISDNAIRAASNLPPLPEPKPDFPAKALLVRLYKAMGGAPEQASAKEAFYRKVNLAILDSIEHDGLKIWARAGEKALKPLDAYDLEHASIDHRKNEVRIPVAYGVDRALTDLHFNKSQVDRLWPKEA